MPLRKARDFRDMPLDDLRNELELAKQRLFECRRLMALSQREDVKEIWRLRKEIARIATVLREKELALEAQRAEE